MLRIDEAIFQQATQKTNFNSCATKLQKLLPGTCPKRIFSGGKYSIYSLLLTFFFKTQENLNITILT